MHETVSLSDPALKIAVRRVARARRISLRVARAGGRVSLTLPPGTPLSLAQRFVEDRADWIRAQLAKAAPMQVIEPGASISILGQAHEVVAVPQPRVALAPGQILIPEDKPCTPVVRALLRDTARVELTAASDRYAAQLGRRYNRLTLRDTRTRWGSCSSAANLMYSWRLAMAPRPVLNYVAAHEVAHLEHMDHSPAFWSVVARLSPGWRDHRAWLRAHGGALQAIHFGD